MKQSRWKRNCEYHYWLYMLLIFIKVKSEVTQLCLTLCDPTDCSLPGFSIHGIFQARILEWVAISFSRGSSWPRDRTQVSHIVDRYFYRLSHHYVELIWKISETGQDLGWGRCRTGFLEFSHVFTIVLHPEILPFLPSQVEGFLDYILSCWTKQTRNSGSKVACGKTRLVSCALQEICK